MKLPRILMLPALFAACCSHAQGEPQAWPQIALPSEVQPFDIGTDLTHNGVPMRLQGFVSPMPPDKAIELFRMRMGRPLVESRLGAQRILGRMQGEYYVSVQIEPAGHGSRGIAAVTHLKAARDSQEATRVSMQRWTARLPAGSHVLSYVNSSDGMKFSSHIVFANGHDESLNALRLESLLAEDGLVLERQPEPASLSRAPLKESIAAPRTLFFKARGKEALATFHRDNDGQTTVVLNVVTLSESSR